MLALGQELSMNGVKQFMEKVWNFVSLPDLYYHEEGYFIARFKTEKDRDEVIRKGPYSIYNMPLFLREWKPDFVIKEDLLRVMPLWVTFPRLPLYLWGDKSLSKIASAVGKPLMTDECTTKKLRVSYARVLVEVDVTQPRRDVLVIKDAEDRRFEQRIEYEWRPLFCAKYQKLGHNCASKQKSFVAGLGGRPAAMNTNVQWKARDNPHQGASTAGGIVAGGASSSGTNTGLSRQDKGKGPMPAAMIPRQVQIGTVLCDNVS